MAAHLAAQILAAVEARITAIGLPVHFVPLHAVPADQLPGVIVSNIADACDGLGPGPINERHALSFDAFVAQYQPADGFANAAGERRAAVEQALLGSKEAVTLGGLCRPGLSRPEAVFDVDADSLGKPVGGWVLKFKCGYHISTAAPDTLIT